jgi:hypothetical protein
MARRRIPTAVLLGSYPHRASVLLAPYCGSTRVLQPKTPKKQANPRLSKNVKTFSPQHRLQNRGNANYH